MMRKNVLINYGQIKANAAQEKRHDSKNDRNTSTRRVDTGRDFP
jgi:hypothetical protein